MALLVGGQRVTPYSILRLLDTHSDVTVVLCVESLQNINSTKHENDQFGTGDDTPYTPMVNPFLVLLYVVPFHISVSPHPGYKSFSDVCEICQSILLNSCLYSIAKQVCDPRG